MKELHVYTDGGSSGNPGPLRYGFIARDEEGNELFRLSHTKEVGTNNEAEMKAILVAMKWLTGLSDKDLLVKMFSDSDLSINWISGSYKCNYDHIKNIRQEIWFIKDHLKRTANFSFEWIKISRDDNPAHEVGGW